MISGADFCEVQSHAWQLSWERCKREVGRLRPGELPPLSDVGEKQVFLTLVARPEASMLSRITEVQEELRRVDPQHYYYPASDIHMTILGCTEFVRDLEHVAEHDVQAVGGHCAEVLARYPSFVVRGTGLNVFPTTAFVQLLAEDDTLLRLRQDLASILQAKLAQNGWTRRVPPPYLAYANIVRFTHDELRPMLEAVGRYRAHDFGRWLVTNAELVTGNRVLASATTQTWLWIEQGVR
jgi:2'-5' RNA ligase